MGLASWLYGKGLVGNIARKLVVDYIGILEKFPEEDKKNLLKAIYEHWLKYNIRPRNDMRKLDRLEFAISDKDNRDFSSLIDVYQAILMIEIDLDNMDKKEWDDVMKVLLKESESIGLDLTEDYEHFKWVRDMFLPKI